MEKKINLIVKELDKKLRVDVFIHSQEKTLSRTRIKNLILDKKLRLNNVALEDPSKKVKIGDVIDLTIPEPKKASLKPYKYKLDVVYEDNDLLVINKPAGIVMHPGAGNYDKTIVNALINYDKNSESFIQLKKRFDLEINDYVIRGTHLEKNTALILPVLESKGTVSIDRTTGKLVFQSGNNFGSSPTITADCVLQEKDAPKKF